MLRSMYSGVSGMKGFQTKLDVIGNNIANVNTIGFKKSTINFQDLLSQNISDSGVNPMQVGLGIKTSSINVVHTTGSAMTTGVGTDLSIMGDGFFVVQDFNKAQEVGNEDGRYLTRAGNFIVDEGGNLVTSQGYSVVGKYLNPNETKGINVNTVDIGDNENQEVLSININRQGEIWGKTASGEEGLIATIAMSSPSNASGLKKFGGSLYEITNAGGGILTNENLGTASTANTSIASGLLEISNVDLTEEFTEMVVAQRGFQANSRIVTTSDEMMQEVINMKR